MVRQLVIAWCAIAFPAYALGMDHTLWSWIFVAPLILLPVVAVLGLIFGFFTLS